MIHHRWLRMPRSPNWPGSWTTLYITCGKATKVGSWCTSGKLALEDRSARQIVAVVAQQLLVSLERIAAAEGHKCRYGMVGHRVMHAPENGQTIHDPGGPGHVLANAQAWYAGGNRAEESPDLAWRRGFDVPGIEMAGTTVIQNQHARLDR